MSVIGITATRNGMTIAQKSVVGKLLSDSYTLGAVNVFHHGDCVGGDAESHDIAREIGYWIVIHPPTDKKLRAFKIADEYKKEFSYLERNRNIVHAINKLIAVPYEMLEKKSGGTWYTIRYARNLTFRVIGLSVILPNGATQNA